jgi:hypothetical protein
VTLRASLRSLTFVVISALISTAALGQSAGDVSGRVVDDGARPITGARLELKPGSRHVVSDEEGRFRFRDVAPGKYTIEVQRIGYQAVSVPVEVTRTGAKPTIVLTAIPRILDSVRISERAAPNRFSATVLDESDHPIPDVAVTSEGISNTLRTDSSGHFIVPKQVHGTLVIRLRKIGYGPYLGSLRMFATRDDTLRMSHLAQGLTAIQITEASGFGRDTFAYKELDQRMRWRDHNAAVVSREELSEMGRLNLCTALPFTPTGARYGAGRACGGSCVILNGGSAVALPARAYYADQVEMVEFFPPKSDWSGSLAARGCGRGGISTLVIWLRQDTTSKP